MYKAQIKIDGDLMATTCTAFDNGTVQVYARWLELNRLHSLLYYAGYDVLDKKRDPLRQSYGVLLFDSTDKPYFKF